MPALHDDELHLDARVVAALVEESLPQHAHLRVRPLASSGSTNALYRLGDDLLVRLPRQPGGSEAIEKEATWLPVVADVVPVPVPHVVALGQPGAGYPEKWLVTTWLEGRHPDVPWRPRTATGATSSDALARDLAAAITGLRSLEVPPDRAGTPALTGYRGGPLAGLVDDFDEAVAACRTIDGLDLDLDHVRAVWADALTAERALPDRQTWYHCDLLAENLLVTRDGSRLAGVLDFGGLAIGDPTVDLIAGWEVLDPTGRVTLKDALDASEDEWRKAAGWALFIAAVTFPYYWDTMPGRCADRLAMARAVLDEM